MSRLEGSKNSKTKDNFNLHNYSMAIISTTLPDPGWILLIEKNKDTISQPLQKFVDVINDLIPVCFEEQELDQLENMTQLAIKSSEADSITANTARTVSEHIGYLLKASKKWFSSLPLHFTKYNSFDNGVKIISGEAWSHDSTSKNVQILDFFNESDGEDELIIWNESGINPVISSPKFLK